MAGHPPCSVRVWVLGALAGVTLLAKLAVATAAGDLLQGPDADAYDEAARALIADPDPLNPDLFDHAYWPPLYPSLIALTYRAVGPHPGAVYALQAVLATGLALILYAAVEPTFGSRTAFVAAYLVLLSPTWLWAVPLLHYELLLAVLLTASLATLVQRPRLLYGVGAGSLLGLAALTQPKALALLIPFGIFAYRYRGHRLALLLVLSCLIPILLYTGRNYLALQAAVPISTNSGVNLWIGNNPRASGGYAEPPPVPGIEAARAGPVGAADFLYRRAALIYIVEHPGTTTKLAAVKAYRLFLPIYPGNLSGGEQGRQLTRLSGLGPKVQKGIGYASALISLGLLVVGFVLCNVRRDWRYAGLFVGALAAYVAAHLPFIAEPRMRWPISPVVQALEAAALVAIAGAVHRTRGPAG